MKKIIKGKRYDTETAKSLGIWSSGYPRDFSHINEELFQKTTGEYFLCGEGGPMSKYAEQIGCNEWSGSWQIIPLTAEKASEWAEKHLTVDEYEAAFGEVAEDESSIVLSVRIPSELKKKLDIYAGKSGKQKIEIISAALTMFFDSQK